MVMADKAYWSRGRSEGCGRHGVANGILRKPSRGEKLKDTDQFILRECQQH
jgi:hypothetical protein